ncbi:hypothetical protein [Clostridium paridis]|uniref:Uncharacterized protein n=1 Tax=Clostridium paridis TaxID=2803863 RepID=A0A937FGX3_9CLOT|nr:hypothetical protein [Clostridium paridis]
MNFNGWSNFEDFAKACGYTNSNNTNNKSSNTSSQGGSTSMGCDDIPNGFQSLDPQLFVIIGTILGDILAGNIPFNVQNALGNWFELLGQVILTYNAQQQYFQAGPGLYFNPKNYNVNNNNCNTPQNTTSNNPSPPTSNDEMSKIKELENRINSLVSEIEFIKNNLK